MTGCWCPHLCERVDCDAAEVKLWLGRHINGKNPLAPAEKISATAPPNIHMQIGDFFSFFNKKSQLCKSYRENDIYPTIKFLFFSVDYLQNEPQDQKVLVWRIMNVEVQGKHWCGDE